MEKSRAVRLQQFKTAGAATSRQFVLGLLLDSIQTFLLNLTCADSMSSTILLCDASCSEFRTFNSAVINTVIEEMKSTQDSKVREVIAQIKF